MKYLSIIFLILCTTALLITSCGEADEDLVALSNEIREHIEHSLISSTQPSDDVLRLTFRNNAELRNLDQTSDEIRRIATFAIDNFGRGNQISMVEIVLDEPSMNAVTTAASRTVLRVETDSL